MYENEKNEKYWLDLAEDKGEELGVDTREGSVYIDTQAGHCMRTAKFYNDLEIAHEAIMPDTATGDILTQYAAMDGIYRIAATSSYWTADFVGTEPSEGSEFMYNGYYFTYKNIDGVKYLVSNDLGESTNSLPSGEDLIPVEGNGDLESATLGELVISGKSEEKDDVLRARWRESKANPRITSLMVAAMKM